MRKCAKCLKAKSDEDFSWDSRRSRVKPWCKGCLNAAALLYHRTHPEKHRKACKAWADKNPAKVLKIRRAFKLRKYGISESQHSALRDTQKGVCAICGEQTKFRIDHDHSTGQVRGLLCHGCNAGLGFFKDDPERLRAAQSYLYRYQQ